MLLKKEPSLEYILPDLTSIPIPSPPSPPPSLPTLPPELYAFILPHLPYPDSLSLKHTCTLFYNLVDTSIKQKLFGQRCRRYEDMSEVDRYRMVADVIVTDEHLGKVKVL
ncbi:MAG: hypothetical protein Q9186_006137 [Xanthomendoza sp. 1 TL-2023]